MEAFDLTLLRQGGPMMWVLLLISIVGFVISIERTLFLHRGQIRSMDFVDGIKNLLRKRRLVEALTVCEETPGPLAHIVKAGLLHAGRSEEEMRRAIQEAALVEIPVLERRINTIAVIARIAPLVGLLGTLVAAIQMLYAMNEAGPYANSAAFSGMMAQALITTAAGIAVGLIAQVAFYFLHGRVRALIHDIEFVGHHLMQFLLQENRVWLDAGGSAAPADPRTSETPT